MVIGALGLHSTVLHTLILLAMFVCMDQILQVELEPFPLILRSRNSTTELKFYTLVQFR